jgi:DNA-binding IclR family transcriptional regulator
MAVKSSSSTHDPAPPATKDKTAGIAAVDRALRVLLAFGEGDRGLTLGELSQRTGLYKSALSRIMATLIRHRFAMRHEDGRYGLGPSLYRLGGLYERSVDLSGALSPTLQVLARETGESASFYVRHENERLCLMRVASRQQVRDHIPVGSLLPLDRGAAGRILMHFTRPGIGPMEPAFVATTIGERDRELAAVAAPVFGTRQQLMGALCVSGTATRFSEAERLARIQDLVFRNAARLTLTLGGDASVFPRENEPPPPGALTSTRGRRGSRAK